jgi:RNA polymerase sigma-70 factor (ECF subfamily)
LLPKRRAEPRRQRIDPALSDAELIARIAQGDQWAKEALYRRHVRYVWGTAVRLLGRVSEAEDVVQDTFAEALRDWAKLRDRNATRQWLVRIAVHQAHRRFRRRKLLRALGLDRTPPERTFAALVYRGASPETQAELRMVGEALDTLGIRERFAWSLRYVEGYSLEEVAAACDCSLATAKRRIVSAQRRVAVHLADGGRP